jgi:hypothetical protein
MPLRSYAISVDLIDGLSELSRREGISINELVRRAIRRELQRQGIQWSMESAYERQPKNTDPPAHDQSNAP